MTTPTKQNPIPKVMALVLVSIGVACLMLRFDASSLAKLDTISAEELVRHERALHHHSFGFHFIVFLIIGGFYVGIVEFLTYVMGLCVKRSDA